MKAIFNLLCLLSLLLIVGSSFTQVHSLKVKTLKDLSLAVVALEKVAKPWIVDRSLFAHFSQVYDKDQYNKALNSVHCCLDSSPCFICCSSPLPRSLAKKVVEVGSILGVCDLYPPAVYLVMTLQGKEKEAAKLFTLTSMQSTIVKQIKKNVFKNEKGIRLTLDDIIKIKPLHKKEALLLKTCCSFLLLATRQEGWREYKKEVTPKTLENASSMEIQVHGRLSSYKNRYDKFRNYRTRDHYFWSSLYHSNYWESKFWYNIGLYNFVFKQNSSKVNLILNNWLSEKLYANAIPRNNLKVELHKVLPFLDKFLTPANIVDLLGYDPQVNKEIYRSPLIKQEAIRYIIKNFMPPNPWMVLIEEVNKVIDTLNPQESPYFNPGAISPVNLEKARWSMKSMDIEKAIRKKVAFNSSIAEDFSQANIEANKFIQRYLCWNISYSLICWLLNLPLSKFSFQEGSDFIEKKLSLLNTRDLLKDFIKRTNFKKKCGMDLVTLSHNNQTDVEGLLKGLLTIQGWQEIKQLMEDKNFKDHLSLQLLQHLLEKNRVAYSYCLGSSISSSVHALTTLEHVNKQLMQEYSYRKTSKVYVFQMPQVIEPLEADDDYKTEADNENTSSLFQNLIRLLRGRCGGTFSF